MTKAVEITVVEPGSEPDQPADTAPVTPVEAVSEPKGDVEMWLALQEDIRERPNPSQELIGVGSMAVRGAIV